MQAEQKHLHAQPLALQKRQRLLAPGPCRPRQLRQHCDLWSCYCYRCRSRHSHPSWEQSESSTANYCGYDYGLHRQTMTSQPLAAPRRHHHHCHYQYHCQHPL